MTTTRSRADGPTKRHFLLEAKLFAGLGQQDLAEIERNASMSTCPRGTVFFTPEETGQVLFLLKRGRVNLYRVTEDGKKLVTATVEPGSFFGEMMLIGQGVNGGFAEATEDSTICVMSRSDLERIIRDHPEVGLRLLEGIAQRLMEAEGRLADIAYKSMPARIASTLLHLIGPDNNVIKLSQQDIADMVGTYRETTTRILNEMRAEGLIELKRMQISVVDTERLAARAAEIGHTL